MKAENSSARHAAPPPFFLLDRRRSVAFARAWPLLLVMALLLASALPARAQADDQSERHVRYRVEIEAPRAIASVLRSALDLVRWEDYEDMTAVVLERLIREGIDQAREAAAAQGYFSAHVDIAVEKPESPEAPLTVRVKVEPGEIARVDGVTLTFTGPATEDTSFGAAAIAKARSDWSLPMGAEFRQEGWDDAKRRVLATIAGSPYAGAAITHSEARVHPDTNTATLTVEIASGPPFFLGDMQIEGLEHYEESVVRNFSILEKGEPYRAERIDEFTRRLLASGYFASAQARIQPNPEEATAAPLRVAVIEALRHRIEGGVSYATDSGPHADARYTDVNFDGHALQLEVSGRIDAKIQNLQVEFRRPPNARGFIDSARASVERTNIESTQTRTAVIGVRRQSVDERNRLGFGTAYYEDEERPTGAPSRHSRALYTEVDYQWRRVDSLVLPTEGYVFNVEGGLAPPGLATQGFGRLIGQYAYWRPLPSHNSLDVRVEGGAVLAKARDGIPSALLFRTGGDTTVRGYGFQTLGVKEGDSIVGGRYYAVASAEVTHHFTDLLGAAVFIDAGNAADDLHGLKPVLGYGVGLRVNSPVGRFRADLAYGQETRDIRLHMSVGVVF